MSTGQIAQEGAWKTREQGEEARYIHQKEQLAALRAASKAKESQSGSAGYGELERDFEGGYGGQEDLEDRYATTSGEH
ncbi:hypothetical protein WOLCODRAFT_96596 [Wolfiporia cocos MD-104 SS10]|uniref:Uncharacterized protein n=1 Tax=Wolfiporia cocos (strain MD-104) TaxID=742152 RepID=A0A2H3JEA8_WOLCO|nr:hypothetical protein WOLCODRAFT_96596 [Wolfiporia cocos MD-104 SS10]